MTEEKDEKYGIVRIQAELIPLIDKVVETDRDQYGINRYRSRQEVVSQALKDFLNKRSREAKKN